MARRSDRCRGGAQADPLAAARAVLRQAALPRPATVVAAVSGGADSLALALVLTRLAPELNLRVVAAHFDHGLRGAESCAAEREAVRRQARCLGLPLQAGGAPPGELRRQRQATGRSPKTSKETPGKNPDTAPAASPADADPSHRKARPNPTTSRPTASPRRSRKSCVAANELYAKGPFSGPSAASKCPAPSAINCCATGSATWTNSARPSRNAANPSSGDSPQTKSSSPGSTPRRRSAY